MSMELVTLRGWRLGEDGDGDGNENDGDGDGNGDGDAMVMVMGWQSGGDSLDGLAVRKAVVLHISASKT